MNADCFFRISGVPVHCFNSKSFDFFCNINRIIIYSNLLGLAFNSYTVILNIAFRCFPYFIRDCDLQIVGNFCFGDILSSNFKWHSCFICNRIGSSYSIFIYIKISFAFNIENQVIRTSIYTNLLYFIIICAEAFAFIFNIRYFWCLFLTVVGICVFKCNSILICIRYYLICS